MIRVQCSTCYLTQDIQPVSAYLVDLAGPHLRWTCHGTHERVCEAVNVQRVPRHEVAWFKATVAELRHPAMVHDDRQEFLPPFTEDEYLELAPEFFRVDHLAALAGVRLPKAVTA